MSTSMSAPAAQPDLHSYDFENDPVGTLTWLRENDPVHWSQHGYWLVSRYEDVRRVLGDAKAFSSSKAGFGANNPLGKTDAAKPKNNKSSTEKGGKKGDNKDSAAEKSLSKGLALSFNQQDPPDHTRVRALVNSAFSRREITERTDQIEAVIAQLMAAAHAKGEFDLVTDFAFHLPIIVAADIIGIPASDRDLFRRNFELAGRLMAPKRSDEEWAEALEGARWQSAYMSKLISARREDPRNDLISALLQACEEDDRLTGGEVASAIMTIFTAAGTTTERMISTGAYLLLSHPAQLAALRADPSLIDSALEEILRFHHPTQSTSTYRRATCDVELGGKTIKAGDTVRVSLGAANRDPEMFDRPEEFDIQRSTAGAGGKHMSFGFGIHFCLGSALARYESKAALQALLLGPQELELVTQTPVKDPSRPDRYKEIRVRFNS